MKADPLSKAGIWPLWGPEQAWFHVSWRCHSQEHFAGGGGCLRLGSKQAEPEEEFSARWFVDGKAFLQEKALKEGRKQNKGKEAGRDVVSGKVWLGLIHRGALQSMNHPAEPFLLWNKALAFVPLSCWLCCLAGLCECSITPATSSLYGWGHNQWMPPSWPHSHISFAIKWVLACCVPMPGGIKQSISPQIVVLDEALPAGKTKPYQQYMPVSMKMNCWHSHDGRSSM